MSADEVNFIASGYSSRFLYCSILDAPVRYLDLLSSPNPSANKLQEKLYWLYAELEKLPEADYLLCREAKVLFQGWNHTLVNAEMEEKHFGLSLVYAKIESYTARIALWLHIVNAVLRREQPLPVISGQTMQHAIEIASFYLDQHKLIHAHNAPTRQPEGIFLKVQTQAEKVLNKSGKGVSASFLKSRINSLKGWAVEKIRSAIFKALAAAGHGRIEGEGSEMVYIPNFPTDNASEELVGIDGELVVAPIVENSTSNSLQASIGEIGAVAHLSNFSQLSEDALASSSNHQFTNSSAQTFTTSDLGLVDDSTNSSPIAPTVKAEPQQLPTKKIQAEQILLCSTWVEIARQVNENTDALLAVAKEMTAQQRQGLTKLLVNHLCQSPAYLTQLAWVPEKLRQRALEKLSFTIRCIADVAGSALDVGWEYISSCRLEQVSQIGTGHETWIFTTPDGANLRAYPTAVEAIAYLGD
jgi:hypothetical protein